jgi:hypothetical protein
MNERNEINRKCERVIQGTFTYSKKVSERSQDRERERERERRMERKKYIDSSKLCLI